MGDPLSGFYPSSSMRCARSLHCRFRLEQGGLVPTRGLTTESDLTLLFHDKCYRTTYRGLQLRLSFQSWPRGVPGLPGRASILFPAVSALL